jgi:ATP-binding cassette subfamily D (ALD) protein 3
MNISKPILDLILFSRKLAQLVGWEGPIWCGLWYLISGIIIKFISPPFGKLTAIEQKMEGEYRSKHTELINHSEEIAFYNGSDWEKMQLN